jgi:signal transduction histidine kinase/CheY-like chemotaxis protein
VHDLPLVPKELRRELAGVLNRVLEKGLTIDRENENVTKDGRNILCQWTNTLLKRDGRGVGVLSMAQDVTERLHVVRELLLDGKRLERMLALSQLKPKTVEELLALSLEEAVALTSSEFGCIAYYDEASRRFTHYSPSRNVEARGEDAYQCVIARIEGAGIWEQVVRGRQPVIVHDFSVPGVQPELPSLMGLLAVPLFVKERIAAVIAVTSSRAGYAKSDAGQLTLLMDSIGRMISLKKAEEALDVAREQLLQSQKMEAVGRLAGGIAHDFNNLLQVMNGHAELLLDDVRDPAKDHVLQLKEVIKKAASLISQLLAFSRKSIVTLSSIDLNELIAGTSRMLRRVIGENIHLSTCLSERAWKIKADRGQIEQVVMNIVVNARDAMPHGGALTIETSNLLLEEGNSSLFPEAAAGEYVQLSVRDTGIGMSEEVRAKIFEPFFTTKPQGKGVGLGLSVVYGVVRQCGAFISCESKIGEWTAIRILFPRTTVAEPEEKAPEVKSSRHESSEIILVVEDNDDVRQIAESFLVQDGYRVLVAENGEEALRKARLSPVDLVLTDVVMPGMNGREVADRLREILPDIRLVFMSGYPSEAISRHGVLDTAVEFLQKPFTREKLLRKVRDVLDRKRAVEAHPGLKTQ